MEHADSRLNDSETIGSDVEAEEFDEVNDFEDVSDNRAFDEDYQWDLADGEGKNDKDTRFGEEAEEAGPFEADGVCLPQLVSPSTYCSIALHYILGMIDSALYHTQIILTASRPANLTMPLPINPTMNRIINYSQTQLQLLQHPIQTMKVIVMYRAVLLI